MYALSCIRGNKVFELELELQYTLVQDCSISIANVTELTVLCQAIDDYYFLLVQCTQPITSVLMTLFQTSWAHYGQSS